MPRASANGIDLEYETFGDPGNPALLLVMGLGAQMTTWDERFCARLADRGYYTIRYDNRDVGLSTWFGSAGVPSLQSLADALLGGAPLPDVPYDLYDMAEDGIGLLDALGIERAHVVGASMGGMIVQAMALRHQERLLSLCSIMSMTGDWSVATPAGDAMGALMQSAPSNREEAIEGGLQAQRIIGSPGFPLDEDDARRRAGLAYDRAFNPDGMARQMAAILASPDRTAALAGVSVPTLVIHGRDDPLVPLPGGEATARAIPGAELLVIPGMGHDLPLEVWPQVVDAIVRNAERAAERAPSTSA